MVSAVVQMVLELNCVAEEDLDHIRFYVVQGMEPGVLCTLGKHSAS